MEPDALISNQYKLTLQSWKYFTPHLTSSPLLHLHHNYCYHIFILSHAQTLSSNRGGVWVNGGCWEKRWGGWREREREREGWRGLGIRVPWALSGNLEIKKAGAGGQSAGGGRCVSGGKQAFISGVYVLTQHSHRPAEPTHVTRLARCSLGFAVHLICYELRWDEWHYNTLH